MKRWEVFQFANRIKRANHWIQVVLILSLILGLNHLALKHFYRFDLTHNHRFALSPETKAHLREMQTPVQIISTIPSDSPRQEERVLFRYVDQLLQEYVYQSRRQGDFLLSTESVDIYKDLARAEALAREYGLDQVNSLLVLAGDRKRLIRADELVAFANRKPVAFTGESALSSAIIEVTQEQSPKIYFTRGHQEVAPDDPDPQTGLSQVTRELQLRNFTVEVVDLTTVDAVPADASVLVLAAPRGPLLSSEVDKIRSYLYDRAGRVIVWLGPGVDAGLDSLLREWGIALPNEIVIEPDPAYREATGTLLIRNIGEHRITQSLIQNQTFIVSGLARPVLPKPPVPADERLHFVPLFATSPASWAESDWRASREAEFDPAVDIKGPVPVAIAAERRASSQLGIKVPGGRLILFGSQDLFSNRRVASLGNISLFFNSLNWMLDRDRMLVIPPRPVDTYKLSFSQSQLRQIGLLFLIVPGSLAICGFLVSWIRQS